MQYNDKGIILRIGRFKEADLWVRFLSPSRGIVTAFAFGGSRSRKRFGGCLDYLNEVHFTIRTGKLGTYTSLEEGSLISSPARLRSDPQRTGVLANCQKFLEAMGISTEGADTAYLLFSETMQLLETAEALDPLLPVFFRARLAFDQGYRPELGHCIHCGDDLEVPDILEQERAANQFVGHSPQDAIGQNGNYSSKNTCVPTSHHRFLVREGVLFCGSCSLPEGPSFRVGKEALDAMRFVQDNSPLRWTELSLSDRARREFSRAVDGFIQYHVGLTWEKGFFRRV